MKLTQTLIGPRTLMVVAALIAASRASAAAVTVNCFWVGAVYQTPMVAGEGGQAASYTWGDSAGWSNTLGSSGGSCPGGTPQNGSNNYTVSIMGATASATIGNLGKTSMLQVVSNGNPISPTISTLNLTSSTLGMDMSTLTTGTLVADNSSIAGGTIQVNGNGTSSLNNVSVQSTAFNFLAGSPTDFTGNLQLARTAVAEGKDPGGPINYGVAPVITAASGALLNFTGVTLYGQNSTSGSLAVIQAQLLSVIDFIGNNSVLGTTLQGNIFAQNGTTTFTGTTNQGVLAPGNGATLNFNNGTMSQLAGAPAPGFVQSSSSVINILDLTATAGTFSGTINLAGNGMSGNPFDNTLTGVTVNSGAALVLNSGSTSFTGANHGQIVTQGGSLTLAGPIDNSGGAITNVAGGITLQDATVTGGTISGDLASNGTSSLNSLGYASGTLSVNSGSLTLNSVNMQNAILAGNAQFNGTNSLNSVTLNNTTTIASGVTTFQGTNQGYLTASSGGSLILTGSVNNNGAAIVNNLSTLTLSNAAVTGGQITGGAYSNGSSEMSSMTYAGGTLYVTGGNLTLQNVTNQSTITSLAGSITLTGNTNGVYIEGTQQSNLSAFIPNAIQLNNATVAGSTLNGDVTANGTNSLTHATFNNSGTMTVGTGATTLGGEVAFNQNYAFNAASGAQLNVNEVLSNAAGKTLTFSGAIANLGGANIRQVGSNGVFFNGAAVNGGTIGNGGTFTGTNSLTSLTLGGTSNITGGSTTLQSVKNQGTINANGGILVLTGSNQTGIINGSTPQSIQLNGVSLTGGQITGGAIANGTNTFSGVQIGGTLEVDGGNTNGAGLTFTGSNPAYLVNGGILALSSSTTVPITIGAAGELNLSGTLTATGVSSAGNIAALSGTSTVSSLSTTGGILQANAGATFGLNNATILNTALVAQSFQVAPGCVQLCAVTPAGVFQATGLNTIFNSSLSGGNLIVTGGTTTLAGNITGSSLTTFIAANTGTFDLSGATVTGGNFGTVGNGVIQVFGQNFMLGGGTQGNFNSSFNGALTLVGSDWDLNPGATTLIGQSGTLALTTGAVHNEGGTVDIQAGGVLEATTLFQQDSGTTTIDGTLHVGSSADPGDIDIYGGAFTYSGDQDIFGNLNFSSAAVGLVADTSNIFGSVSLNGNSMLTGSHTISGNLSNGGDVQPGDAPGIITVAGNYTQTADGTLTIQLGGADPAVPDFDQLMVGGVAYLSGTLDLTSFGGFQPVAGQSFEILEFGSSSGTFSSVDLAGITDTNYQIDYDAHDVTVQFGQGPVAPEPSTWALIAGGLAMLALRGWKRARG